VCKVICLLHTDLVHMLCHGLVRSFQQAVLLPWNTAAADTFLRHTVPTGLGAQKVWGLSITCQHHLNLAQLVAVSSAARNLELVCPTLPLYTAATLQPHTLQYSCLLKLAVLTSCLNILYKEIYSGYLPLL